MLTPAQKIDAYEYALDKIKNGNFYSPICLTLMKWLLHNAPDVFKEVGQTVGIKDIFTELHDQKPGPLTGIWWPLDESGRLTRIDVLTKAIANVKL